MTMANATLLAENERYNPTLSQIQIHWQNYNMYSKVESILQDCFSSAENPYAAALYLMSNNESFLLSKKTSLALFVMNTFKKWLVDNESSLKSSLTSDIKMNAFFTVDKQKNTPLIKLVIEIYKLISDAEMFMPYIKEQISSLNFKQACQTAAFLKLHNHFNVKDFLVQLILQDKLTVVEDFILESPEHQRSIVSFLDELLGKEHTREEMIRISEELKVTDAKVYKFNHKCLSKLVGRYVKDFKIPPEVCPHYIQQQKKKALSFVIWKRYIDKTLEGESWKEMMLEIVKDNPKIQYELVDMLVEYCDVEEAFYWSKHFELDQDKIPGPVKFMYAESNPQHVVEEESWDNYEAESWDQPSSSSDVPYTYVATDVKPVHHKSSASAHYYNSYICDDEWDMETSTGCTSYKVSESFPEEDTSDNQLAASFQKLKCEDDQIEASLLEEKQFEEVEETAQRDRNLDYHALSLSENDIVMVDTTKALLELIEVGLKGVQIVGLDCEWKPSFFSKKSNVALMQLAMWNKIYLIDVLKLSEIYCPIWSDFNRMLFENEEIIKLGFDVHADKSMLLETVPNLKGYGSVSFLDLTSVWKILVNKYSFIFPSQVDEHQGGQSLSQLVSLCFGKVLDKSDQFSNWEKRPLRRSQKIYAALDAYCLLEIYDCLKNSSISQGIPFEDVITMALKCSKPSSSRQNKGKKQKKRVNQKPIENVPTSVAETNYPPAVPQSYKMVCDTMVQGLGRKLRSCGINTWILQNNDSSDMCVKVAIRDQRIILTRGGNYLKFIKYVNPGYCYEIKSDSLDDQVKEVLNFFNITLRKEDIFSRCQICNGDLFAEIHNSIMKQIIMSKGEGVQSFVESDRFDKKDSAAAMGTFPEFGKKWKNRNSCREVGEVTDKTAGGVKIKFHSIPDVLLSKVEYFYACEKCGKVYWDGGHWQRELKRKKEGNFLK